MDELADGGARGKDFSAKGVTGRTTMAKIAIHRLDDWAVGRAILPALLAAGVPEALLEACVFYFARKGTPNPFKLLEDGPGVDAVDGPLHAVGRALARFGASAIGADPADDCMVGFHCPSDDATLEAAATQKRKNDILRMRGSDAAGVDTAIAAIASRRAAGQSEAAIIEAMAAGEIPGQDDGSLDFAWLSFFDRLDRLEEPTLRTLLKRANNLPDDLQSIAEQVCDVFVTPERMQSFELSTLTAIETLASEELCQRCEQAYRERVLADDDASLAQLMQVFDDAGGKLAKQKNVAARFASLLNAALARDDYPLEGLVYAMNRSAIDRKTFEQHVVEAFRRAVANGLRNPDGFGDESSFEDSIEPVAKRDPDLALAGFTALSACFNENGLRSLLRHAGALPKRGYSQSALEAAGKHFSAPERRSAAKIFAKVLKSWGVELAAGGGAPTRPFPSGNDAARILGHEAGE